MHSTTTFILALAASLRLSLGAPTGTLTSRSVSQCGQWDSITTGSYTLFQDLWGESAGTGSQCSSVNSLSGNTLAWSTTWSWADGPSSVKSYANAVVSFTSQPLSMLSSIPTSWAWSYSGTDIVADVSYDTFLGTTASGTASYEVMIWLAALGGAGPISSTGSPIATPTIGSTTFKLYKGPNGSTTVFSFVAESEQTDYTGDLMDFFNYLVTNEGVSSSQFLQSIGAGTEPFTGSDAELTVTAYSTTVEDAAGDRDSAVVVAGTSVTSETVTSTGVAATSATSKSVITTSVTATTVATTPVATTTATSTAVPSATVVQVQGGEPC